MQNSGIHIVCDARDTCGFRVHQDYYAEKPRFMPGLCARCNGPLAFVRAYTNDVVEGVSMHLSGPRAGALAYVDSP